MNLESCLPAALRGPDTTITKIAMGFSGAAVHRVDAGDKAFVLKISDDNEPIDAWRRKLHVLRLAAAADLAPRVVHADDVKRAVLSEFVADKSFPMFFGNPATRDLAILKLGGVLRSVHELPLDGAPDAQDPLQLLARIWSGVETSMALPTFVADAVHRVRAEEPPPVEGALVLSHNDVNPSNLIYDGERLRLLDWDAAGPNDAMYDLATVSVFLRLDDATSLRLLSTHNNAPVTALPRRFAYNRRLVAVLVGVMFVHIARQSGHAGADGTERLESTPSLADFYQKMRTGAVSIGTPEGRWQYGMSMLKHSMSL
jgi:aminoglycoside phosphotransferase (APT) family kinase protein